MQAYGPQEYRHHCFWVLTHLTVYVLYQNRGDFHQARRRLVTMSRFLWNYSRN